MERSAPLAAGGFRRRPGGRDSRPLEQERRQLLQSLAQTRTLISQAYGGFNTTDDADLIDSYVYEINALQSRYNYLIRRAKELEVSL